MKETFGNLIKRRRKELGLMQHEVASKVGVAQHFIAYLESNKRKASTKMVKKLSKVLAIPSDKLYFLVHSELKGVVHYDFEEEKIQRKIPRALLALKKDKNLRKRYKVTDKEIDQLASIRGRSEIQNKEDYIFLLQTLRQVFK